MHICSHCKARFEIPYRKPKSTFRLIGLLLRRGFSIRHPLTEEDQWEECCPNCGTPLRDSE